MTKSLSILAILSLMVFSQLSAQEIIEDKIEERSSLEADNATYELDLKINELKGRYKWLKSNMVE